MTITQDPENNETRALLDMVDFSGKHVLEIGCGERRDRLGPRKSAHADGRADAGLRGQLVCQRRVGDEERGRPGSRRVGWFNPFRYGLLQFPLV